MAFCKLCTFSEAWFPQLCMHICVTCSVVSDSLRPHGLYSTWGSSVHRILQARMLKWVAVPFSRESSQPRDQTHVSCIAGRFFIVWATRYTTYISIKRKKRVACVAKTKTKPQSPIAVKHSYFNTTYRSSLNVFKFMFYCLEVFLCDAQIGPFGSVILPTICYLSCFVFCVCICVYFYSSQLKKKNNNNSFTVIPQRYYYL